MGDSGIAKSRKSIQIPSPFLSQREAREKILRRHSLTHPNTPRKRHKEIVGAREAACKTLRGKDHAGRIENAQKQAVLEIGDCLSRTRKAAVKEQQNVRDKGIAHS